MSVSLNRVPVKEGTAAAAYVLEMKQEELAGYIIVGIRTDGDYEISASAYSKAHATAILADVVSQAMHTMAAEAPPGNPT